MPAIQAMLKKIARSTEVHPLGSFVLIEVDPAPTESEGGIALPLSVFKDSALSSGVVRAVGPEVTAGVSLGSRVAFINNGSGYDIDDNRLVIPQEYITAVLRG